MGKDMPNTMNPKKAGVAILTPEIVGFRAKTITRDKEDHFIMSKGQVK